MGKGIAVLIGFAVTFSFGYAVASNQAGERPVKVETKIVRVPEVITHLETKEVKTPEKMPASCERAIELLADTGKNLGAATKAAGELNLALSDAGIGIVQKDLSVLNPATQTFLDAKRDMTDAAVQLRTDSQTIKAYLDRCKIDQQPHE